MFKHILFATDGSEISTKALVAALGVAQGLGARMTAYHAIPPFTPPIPDMSFGYGCVISPEDYERATRAEAAALMKRIQAAAVAAGVSCDALVEIAPTPWQAIVKAAEKGKCDLIAMASHGRKGLAGLILGSETQKVLIHSTVPVLVCR